MEFSTFPYEYIDLSCILMQRDIQVHCGEDPLDVPEITEEIRLQYIMAYEAVGVSRDHESGTARKGKNIDLLKAQMCLIDFVNVGYYMTVGMSWCTVDGLEAFLDIMKDFKRRYYKQNMGISRLLERIKQLSQCPPVTK